MKNEEIILGIVKENSKQLTSLNREVGEIKAQLSTRRKDKLRSAGIVGLCLSAGILFNNLFNTIVSKL